MNTFVYLYLCYESHNSSPAPWKYRNMLQNKYCTAQYKLGPLSHKFINTKIFQHFPLIFKAFKTQLLKNFKPFKQNHGPCTFKSMKSRDCSLQKYSRCKNLLRALRADKCVYYILSLMLGPHLIISSRLDIVFPSLRLRKLCSELWYL